ncbi:MAG: hypothetical protein PHD46_08085 [Eubacteriales bacterium]|nr:hypothetical protein [Eubacteriales bacterium]MDD4422971.1 hypothetical protein [Eubacteriales bacterium]HBR32439.1 hypothetical protein [Clostridiales bacterium]
MNKLRKKAINCFIDLKFFENEEITEEKAEEFLNSINDEDFNRYISLRRTLYLKSIRNCIVIVALFFCVWSFLYFYI